MIPEQVRWLLYIKKILLIIPTFSKPELINCIFILKLSLYIHCTRAALEVNDTNSVSETTSDVIWLI